ncbi:MAG: hypothetical protein AAF961_14830, partial [Planctomycetota bacterium]
SPSQAGLDDAEVTALIQAAVRYHAPNQPLVFTEDLTYFDVLSRFRAANRSCLSINRSAASFRAAADGFAQARRLRKLHRPTGRSKIGLFG